MPHRVYTTVLLVLTVFLTMVGVAVPNVSHAQDPVVFRVDDLGYGSPAQREELDLDTPRSALETFQSLAGQGDFSTAALALDLRSIPEDERAQRAPELAEYLHAVLERRVWVDWERLPDRPDGLQDWKEGDQALSGEARRSFRLTTLRLKSIPVSIRLSRLHTPDSAPVWVFSRQTVRNIDALHEAFGPNRLEQAIPQTLRGEAFAGLEWWELIAAPLLLLITTAAGLLTYRRVGRVVPNSGRGWSAMLRGVQLPLALLVSTAILWATLNYIVTFSGPVTLFLDPLTIALVILAAVFLVSAAMDTVIDIAIREDVDDLSADRHENLRNRYTNVSAARRLIILVLLITGFGFVLSQTNLFANLGLSILASASVVGLAVGFAAREVLSNILASLQIAFSKSARIGDRLIYDGYLCTVEQIYFTYVQLLTWDDRRLVVPVNELVSTPFENLTLRESKMVRSVTLLLDHRADPDLLRDTFHDFVESDDRVTEKDEAALEVIEHSREGIHARFHFSSPNPAEGWDAHNDLRERLLKRCRELEEERDLPMLPTETERKLDARHSGGRQDS